MASKAAKGVLLLLLAAPAAAGLFDKTWPGMDHVDSDPPEEGGRYIAKPCDDTGLMASPVGGRLPAPKGTSFDELTPMEHQLLVSTKDAVADIRLESPAFENGGPIPEKYSRDGGDASPPLRWIGVPVEAKSLLLIVDDPDSDPTDPKSYYVTHWLLYDLPPNIGSLPEGVEKNLDGPQGSKQGTNDFGKVGWSGPRPPCGTHRYHFKIYALSEPTGHKAGEKRSKLLFEIRGKVLGKGELLGSYTARSQAALPAKPR